MMARCPICLEPVADKIKAVPDTCDHIFCLPCLEKWSRYETVCPVDRKRFKKIFNISGDQTIYLKPKKQKKSKDMYDISVSCEKCGFNESDSLLLLCDCCDLAYHMECLVPALKTVPSGPWYCDLCDAVHDKLVSGRGLTKEIDDIALENTNLQGPPAEIENIASTSYHEEAQLKLDNKKPNNLKSSECRDDWFKSRASEQDESINRSPLSEVDTSTSDGPHLLNKRGRPRNSSNTESAYRSKNAQNMPSSSGTSSDTSTASENGNSAKNLASLVSQIVSQQRKKRVRPQRSRACKNSLSSTLKKCKRGGRPRKCKDKHATFYSEDFRNAESLPENILCASENSCTNSNRSSTSTENSFGSSVGSGISAEETTYNARIGDSSNDLKMTIYKKLSGITNNAPVPQQLSCYSTNNTSTPNHSLFSSTGIVQDINNESYSDVEISFSEKHRNRAINPDSPPQLSHFSPGKASTFNDSSILEVDGINSKSSKGEIRILGNPYTMDVPYTTAVLFETPPKLFPCFPTDASTSSNASIFSSEFEVGDANSKSRFDSEISILEDPCMSNQNTAPQFSVFKKEDNVFSSSANATFSSEFEVQDTNSKPASDVEITVLDYPCVSNRDTAATLPFSVFKKQGRGFVSSEKYVDSNPIVIGTERISSESHQQFGVKHSPKPQNIQRATGKPNGEGRDINPLDNFAAREIQYAIRAQMTLPAELKKIEMEKWKHKLKKFTKRKYPRTLFLQNKTSVNMASTSKPCSFVQIQTKSSRYRNLDILDPLNRDRCKNNQSSYGGGNSLGLNAFQSSIYQSDMCSHKSNFSVTEFSVVPRPTVAQSYNHNDSHDILRKSLGTKNLQHLAVREDGSLYMNWRK